DYEVLDKRYPIVDWESKFYHTDRYGKPHDYYRVFRADGSSRYIKTFTEMVSRFDRLDFIELHSLVMKRFETSTPEGIDLILCGSLRTLFEANAEDDLRKNQEEWILKSWNFYDNCEVHILVLEDGTEFYMLAERRYPLTKETLERMLALRLIAEYESEVINSVRCVPFEALYGRKYRSLIMWVEVGEGQLIGPELVQETTEKISQIKDRLKAARDCSVAYKLDLLEELNGIHDTFHVSSLKKRLADSTLQVPLDEIRVDVKLNFVEEPVEILEREFKKLKRSRIAIVKVRWNSKRRPEFT
ncbi:hypothetical protein Tco_0077124, partial [Tanacetum coccineum]